MNYWLLKTEPDVFSIDALRGCRNRTTPWDGVRNYQARNYLRDQMRLGDRAFFYHSSCPAPGIAGIVEIVREAYPDPSQFDPGSEYYDPASSAANPRWMLVDVRLERALDRLIPLSELRKHAGGKLATLPLLRRGNRLSVLPVTEAQWHFILTLE